MMLFIVIMHMSGGSIDLEMVRGDFTINNLWILFYRSITFLGVPTFAFISGYYGIVCNYRKIWGLECMALFYGVLIILINFMFKHPIGFHEIRNLLLPASSGHLWYYSVYILLALSSPYITPSINKMSNLELTKYTLSLLVISYCFRTVIMGIGNDFLLLLSIFLMGQLLRRFPQNFFRKNARLCFVICQFLNFFIILILLYLEKGSLCRYFDGSTNFLTIISAICLFYMMLNLKNEGAIIRKISILAPSMLTVYIFHEGLRISGAIDISFLQARLLYILPVSGAILLTISLFERSRVKIMTKYESCVYDRIKNKVKIGLMNL